MRLPSPTILALVAALAAGRALGADPAVDTSDWKCEQCPFFAGDEGAVEAGAFYPSGANASYGRYTGIDESHVYADVSASGVLQSADGRYLTYEAEDLGLASRQASIEAGQHGRYAVKLGYDGQPVRLYDNTVTPYRGAGGGTLTLPSDWVTAGSTGAMTALNSSLAPLKLEYDRRTVDLSGHYLFGAGWTFYGELSRQEKDGTGLIGASFLTQAIELPQPINYVTTAFEAGARWSGTSSSVRIAYLGSWFRNDIDALTFANPYPPIVPGSVQGQLALPPGNDLQQVTASGDLRLALATTLSFALSLGTLRQDDAFLPVSTLPGTAPLVPGSLDGDVHLSHYKLGLSSRPLTRLYLRGTASYDGRDDHTAVLTVPYIVTDTFPGGSATALRYGQDRTRLEGSADYTLAHWVRIGVGGTYQNLHYAPGQVVSWTDDGQGWARAIITPREGLTLTLKGGGDTRKASSFDALALPPTENPLVRAYNIAPRDRRFYSLSGSWSISPTVTWSLEGFAADDTYPLSPLGLQSAQERRIASTLTYVPREWLSLYVDAAYQRQYALQDGFTGPVTAPWQVADSERFWSASAGMRLQLRTHWDLTLDYLHAPSYANTDTLAGGLEQPFPENSTTLDSAHFDLRYQWSTALSLHLRYAYEKYNTSDWALAGVGPATLPNLLSVGRAPYYHDVNLVGITVRYLFGSSGATPPKAE